jgi:YidC/Oxa1 family membrane protein insertase
MFELLIVKPIFNLLVFIYALLPGHNFGLSLVIFTIIVRLLMWPLVKKQLHHTKAMRELQPEIKRIKQSAKGNRQQESLMIMELYKERQISPFGSIGILIIQLIILIGLYQGLQRVIADPQAIITYSYGWLNNFAWLKELAADIQRFDATFLGFIDLTRSAIGKTGGIYWPAMLLVFGSAVTQYYQSKQLMPDDQNARSLRKILKEASAGKQADQSEVQAATGRTMRYMIPGLIFIFTVGIASALALYWFVSGLVAYWQQARILKQDEHELESTGSSPAKSNIIEGEVIQKNPRSNPSSKNKKSSSKSKRRKR